MKAGASIDHSVALILANGEEEGEGNSLRNINFRKLGLFQGGIYNRMLLMVSFVQQQICLH